MTDREWEEHTKTETESKTARCEGVAAKQTESRKRMIEEEQEMVAVDEETGVGLELVIVVVVVEEEEEEVEGGRPTPTPDETVTNQHDGKDKIRKEENKEMRRGCKALKRACIQTATYSDDAHSLARVEAPMVKLARTVLPAGLGGGGAAAKLPYTVTDRVRGR